MTDGTGAFPGITTYGTAYDYDPDYGLGSDLVSSKIGL